MVSSKAGIRRIFANCGGPHRDRVGGQVLQSGHHVAAGGRLRANDGFDRFTGYAKPWGHRQPGPDCRPKLVGLTPMKKRVGDVFKAIYRHGELLFDSHGEAKLTLLICGQESQPRPAVSQLSA